VAKAPEPAPAPKTPDIALEREKKLKEQKEQKERELEQQQQQKKKELEAKQRAEDEAEKKQAQLKEQQKEQQKKLADQKKQQESRRQAGRSQEGRRCHQAGRCRPRRHAQAHAGHGRCQRQQTTPRATRMRSSGPSEGLWRQGALEPPFALTSCTPMPTLVKREPGRLNSMFSLAPDGTIVGVKLSKSSGLPGWDEAAERGLRKTDKLPRDTDGRIFPSLIVSLRPKR
jgi:colicin import membrane protein